MPISPNDLTATLEDDLQAARASPRSAEAGVDTEGQNTTALNARFRQNLRMGTMSTSEGVQKRNAFTAFAAFRIEGLEVSLNHARKIAVREELGDRKSVV